MIITGAAPLTASSRNFSSSGPRQARTICTIGTLSAIKQAQELLAFLDCRIPVSGATVEHGTAVASVK